MIALLFGHPDWHRNIEQTVTNGPIRCGKDSAPRIRKCALRTPLGRGVLFAAGNVPESRFPTSTARHALCRLAMDVLLQRAFRRGWLLYPPPAKGAAD